MFDIDGKYREEELETILTRQIYPSGRCCRAKQPDLARDYPLYEVVFSFESALQLLEEQLNLTVPEEISKESDLSGFMNKHVNYGYGKPDEVQSPASFNMFLYDRRYFSNLRQSLFELEGDSLKSGGRKSRGFHKYRVKLMEDLHHEGDPNFHCEYYRNPQDYDQCLETEYITKTKGSMQ